MLPVPALIIAGRLPGLAVSTLRVAQAVPALLPVSALKSAGWLSLLPVPALLPIPALIVPLLPVPALGVPGGLPLLPIPALVAAGRLRGLAVAFLYAFALRYIRMLPVALRSILPALETALPLCPVVLALAG